MNIRPLLACSLACVIPFYLNSCDSSEEEEDEKSPKKKKEKPVPKDPVLESSEQLLISEIVPHAGHDFKDDDGAASDWIELYNNSSEAIALDSFALTDDKKTPLKWQFPSRTLEAGAFLTVFASGKDLSEEGGYLHTNFKLDSDGEYLALVQIESKKAVHTFAPVYPKVPKGMSYGCEFSDGNLVIDKFRLFDTPSPGQPNADTPASPAPKPESAPDEASP